MKHLSYLPYFLLFVAPIAAKSSPAQAADIPVKTQAVDARTVRDDNDLRTIEIVTDRDETVAQFFARQKLVLVNNAIIKIEKPTVQELIANDAKFFASYPLQNDQDFRLYRYGDYFQLKKPAPAVAALFTDDANWSNTMLILAPDATATDDDVNKKARLVGRIFIKDSGKWNPEMDAAALRYQTPKAKTD